MPANYVVPWSGEVINDPDNSIVPVSLNAQNTYLGVYILDNFDITERLGLHVGARFNDAIISLQDLNGNEFRVNGGPNINGTNSFNRINPVVGLTYKITPDISVYGSYSEANRAPTPLEIGCSSPQTPCVIDNFLVADPPLKQIVARTFEAGFKGSNQIAWAAAPGRLDWSVSAYHTENYNDIYSVPSPNDPTLGYYTNAGNTLREGVDIGATYTTDRWDVYASYSYIKAVFLNQLELSSPNNPTAVDGNILVQPGDNLPGIPNNKFKFGGDYEVLPGWKVGGDVVYHSSQYYFGAENNTITAAGGPYFDPQISGYATVNGFVNPLIRSPRMSRSMASSTMHLIIAEPPTGYFIPPSDIENSTTGKCVPGYFCPLPNNDPRAVTLAPPLEAFVGVKVTDNVPPPAPPLVTAKY